ncbi:MAG TPA: hypothetical protein VNM91_03860 [Dehalococcoidia bacterium]|nr:hypothetical protein [Dehalococcoidia bacterium]
MGVSLLAAMACDEDDSQPERTPEPSATVVASAEASAAPSQTVSPIATPPSGATGVIEGSLSYPAGALHPKLAACAHAVATSDVYCTAERITDERFTYGVGYRLRVPPGTYLVYLSVPLADGTEFRGWWSEFAACGIVPPCDRSRNAILEVTVTEGDVITDINPEDWYTQNPWQEPAR